jgi:hypothetical protein
MVQIYLSRGLFTSIAAGFVVLACGSSGNVPEESERAATEETALTGFGYCVTAWSKGRWTLTGQCFGAAHGGYACSSGASISCLAGAPPIRNGAHSCATHYFANVDLARSCSW